MEVGVGGGEGRWASMLTEQASDTEFRSPAPMSKPLWTWGPVITVLRQDGPTGGSCWCVPGSGRALSQGGGGESGSCSSRVPVSSLCVHSKLERS